MSTNTNDSLKMQCAFAAIEKRITQDIPKLTQDVSQNKPYIYYGDDNLYPEYLWNLYNDVSTLKTIVDGTADFITGDDVHCNIPGMEVQVNRKGDTMRDLIKNLAKDYEIYGGCAYEVIRNKNGKPAELNYIDFRYLRTDENNQAFYFSTGTAERSGGKRSDQLTPKHRALPPCVFHFLGNCAKKRAAGTGFLKIVKWFGSGGGHWQLFYCRNNALFFLFQSCYNKDHTFSFGEASS